jgi:PAS domain-containing protein
MTHPDDLAVDVHQFNRVMAGEIEGYSLDKRWIRKDGRVIHSIMSAKCLRRADGSVDYFVGLVLDTTERKRAEERLQRSEAYLAEGQRISHTGSWAVKLPSEEIFWSEEVFRIYGLDPDTTNLSQRMAFQLIHPDVALRCIDKVSACSRAPGLERIRRSHRVRRHSRRYNRTQARRRSFT